MRSPAGRPFLLPTAGLAEAIAAEWQSQGEQIKPASMPLMQLAATAIDRVADEPGATVKGIAGFAETDLVCYRAEGPRSLFERQEQLWQPLVDWVRLQYDAPLIVVTGIMPRSQPPEALRAIEAAVAALEPFRLTALAAATAAAGSVVLGLALLEGRLTGAEVHDLSLLDETYQTERWGVDEEAARRQADLKAEIQSAERFLTLLSA
ncbi:ATPase [Hypericibacter adhaerens]|jgi:chaperone required for assembly of F1-ATPase|uniref:ATPase n=2 Tax=Hypericibacter adhaerens TaxID=2602016 RepID=A0A5J6MZ79_9PROT|nr:ATPase [Hypericibacter adhaerens]